MKKVLPRGKLTTKSQANPSSSIDIPYFESTAHSANSKTQEMVDIPLVQDFVGRKLPSQPRIYKASCTTRNLNLGNISSNP